MQHELEWIRGALADRRLDKVSEATGLHPNTIAAIRDGKQSNPKLSTLHMLAVYLRAVCK
jgi:transcriptional regulator with XRE-family HTH domain